MSAPLSPFASLREAARLIARRKLSSIEVVDATLARIERLNPTLGAFLTVTTEAARRDAQAAERAVRTRKPLGPLHGVPISVKDLILTRDAPTTAGSKVFGAGLASADDAPVVRRLRHAGAILVGKTNLHEVALGVTTVNEHFGPARNPWNLEHVSGGSSGGSAVAVAAGLGYGSVGTDTRGSIRIPAACCGITGLKPTFGLVSTELVVPLGPTMDHVGPMTRSVEDAALMLGAMLGRRSALERYLRATGRRARGLRLGVSEYYLRDLDTEIARAVEKAMEAFHRAGCRMLEVSVPELESAQQASGVIVAAEALAFHEERLKRQPDAYGPLVRGRLEKGAQFTALDYVRAEETRVLLTAGFGALFREIDCLVGATLPALPPRIGEHSVRIGGSEANTVESFTRLNSPQNVAGVPALVLPCGLSASGFPIGLQLIAPWEREEVLFSLGAAFQRETDWHLKRPPATPA